MATAIGNLGTIPTQTVGGRVFTDLTNLIVTSCWTSTNPQATFRAPGGSSGRVVTTGKTLTVNALRMVATSNTAAQSRSNLTQSDNDVGMDSATALTNPVYYAGTSGALVFAAATGGSITSAAYQPMAEYGSINMTAAATKYLSVSGGNSGGLAFTAFGYEA